MNAEVVGVSGGEEGSAGWAKLKFGVVGRSMAMTFIVERVLAVGREVCSGNERLFLLCFWVKESMPEVGISGKEKEGVEGCNS